MIAAVLLHLFDCCYISVNGGELQPPPTITGTSITIPQGSGPGFSLSVAELTTARLSNCGRKAELTTTCGRDVEIMFFDVTAVDIGKLADACI